MKKNKLLFVFWGVFAAVLVVSATGGLRVARADTLVWVVIAGGTNPALSPNPVDTVLTGTGYVTGDISPTYCALASNPQAGLQVWIPSTPQPLLANQFSVSVDGNTSGGVTLTQIAAGVHADCANTNNHQGPSLAPYEYNYSFSVNTASLSNGTHTVQMCVSGVYPNSWPAGEIPGETATYCPPTESFTVQHSVSQPELAVNGIQAPGTFIAPDVHDELTKTSQATVMNVGDSESNMDWDSNPNSLTLYGYSPTHSGAGGTGMLPKWLSIAKAGGLSGIPGGGSTDVAFIYDHTQATEVGSLPNTATVGFFCNDRPCKDNGNPVAYKVNYYVPSPIITSFTASSSVVAPGATSILAWKTQYTNDTNPIVSITGDDGESWTSGLSANGQVTTNALTKTTTFTIKVKGLSNVDSRMEDNFATQSVTVTIAGGPICTPGQQIACTSPPNACDMTNPGTMTCNGDGTGFSSCSATSPPDSDCPSSSATLSISPGNTFTIDSPWTLGLTSTEKNKNFELHARQISGGVDGGWNWEPEGPTDEQGSWSISGGPGSWGPSDVGTWYEYVWFADGTQSNTITFTISSSGNQPPGNPPPGGSVTCSPASQNVAVGGFAQFSASGGDGTYTWMFPGAFSYWYSPPTAEYESEGTYWVTVTSASQYGQCSVTVGPSQYYSCSNGSCVVDANGSYTTSDCNKSCGSGRHLKCAKNMCALVFGTGIDQCSPVNSACVDNPPHYSCSNGSCILNESGPYTTSDCDNSCGPEQYYSCSGGSCVPDVWGPYTTSDCNNSCIGGPPPPRYSCSKGSCVVDANGFYTTSDCNNSCIGGPPNTHLECVDNACTSVSGSGVDRCGTNNDCGPGITHAICDATQKACVNVQGSGADTCSTDPACGTSNPTHLICENNSCLIVSGAGIDQCNTPGLTCTTSPVVITTFRAVSLAPIVHPEKATLLWTSSGATSCSINHGVGDVATNGNTTVAPTATTTYILTCTGPGGSDSKSVTITVGGPGQIEIPPS